MYNGNRIKELLVERNLSNKELLNYLGVDCNGSISQLTNGNPTAKKLEKVADFLGVSLDEFFIREVDFIETKGLSKEVNYLKDKVLLLEKLLDDKSRIISLLEDKIEHLSADKSRTKSDK